MKLEDQNLLFFSRSTQHGGTENVILQLCEIFHPLVNKIVVVSSDGFADKKLKSFGIKHYSIPDIESKSPTTIITVSRAIKEIVKNEKITVIHTHHRMAAFYVRLLGLYRKCHFINTSHNAFYNHRALTRYAYKKADLIACGEMVKKNLVDVFGLQNVTVIHNAVKPFDGNVVPDHEIREAKDRGLFLIGNIGRLSEQKGMEYFIQAIPGVMEKHPEVHFYIIGTGEDEEKLKEIGKGLPISFMGYRTDIQNLMSQLDLIVLSSLWEGLPLTPIEAFSMGKTVVATAVDGTPEIVKDGVNGMLVEPKSPEQIAKAVCELLSNSGKRKLLETNAKQTFVENFSFDAFAQKYVRAYEEIKK